MPEIIKSRRVDKVPASSRYHATHLVYWRNKLTYPIYKKKKLSFAPSDQHYEITKEVEYKPQLVSFRFYGTVDFWWRIMEMNGMKDVLEFKAGRNIVLPGSNLLF
jgi:hypothetical protein